MLYFFSVGGDFFLKLGLLGYLLVKEDYVN